MRALFLSALVLSSSLTHVPASAMGYAESAASGVSPVTANEMLDCAFYWQAWADSLDPDYYGEGSGIWDPSWLAKLNPAVQLPAAQDTATYWFGRAEAKFKADRKKREFTERMANPPKYNVEALDERKFLQLLGECARPAK